ncbi:GntR family transcriptional regulator of gluconate operon [Salibacterium salarium]|uniref:GntR family transcriptional regulator n=1 Tax=Salibacterium salarium TaxID=284579 RepID=UPI002782C7E4|nr:GntR family transcriptional regulator [Salibacterium salarium]MDQ0297906.1 GntR family transcriptional regulator of gluconate operon [Salibacterium salarium]
MICVGIFFIFETTCRQVYRIVGAGIFLEIRYEGVYMMKLSRQYHDSLGRQISFELRLNIISGDIPPGERLSENQISDQFGTSRSPVREALKTLAQEGLIRLERMGAVVIGLNATEVEELYEVRNLIESFALKRLVSMDTTHLVKQLEITLDKMQVAHRYGNDEEFAYLDYAFHESIILSIHHNRIQYVWDGMKHIIFAVLLITTAKRFERKEDMTGMIAKHQEIVHSIQSGEKEQVETTLNEHYEDTYRSIQSLL